MTLKHVLNLFSKTEVQEDKTHPCHLSQTILNRLFGRVLEREGVSISCAKHTVKNLFTSKKVAFTLAEVLITLGIIGVVAALTLPTLIANHKKQTYVNQLKKVVNTLENAAQLAVADEGVSSFKDTELSCLVFNQYSCTSWYEHSDLKNKNLLSKYIKYVDFGSFYTIEYKKLDGSSNEIYGNIGFILPDGVRILVLDISAYSYDGGIDINGDKGPNVLGRDVFRIGLSNNGTIEEATLDGNAFCKNISESQYLEKGCYYSKIVADGWKMGY